MVREMDYPKTTEYTVKETKTMLIPTPGQWRPVPFVKTTLMMQPCERLGNKMMKKLYLEKN